MLTHESCLHTSTDTGQTEETYDAQSSVRGTLRATCFLQCSTGLGGRDALAHPGTPHHRITLPKVDSRASVLGSNLRCTPRILLGER